MDSRFRVIQPGNLELPGVCKFTFPTIGVPIISARISFTETQAGTVAVTSLLCCIFGKAWANLNPNPKP